MSCARLCWAPLVLVAVLAAGSALAHTPASSHLTIDLRNDERATLTADLALVDLAQVMTIDTDDDGRVTWGEVRTLRPGIASYVRGHLGLGRGGTDCDLGPEGRDTAMIEYGGVPHVSMPFSLGCAGDTAYTVSSSLFLDIDPEHRAIVKVQGGQERLLVLSDERRSASFDMSRQPGLGGMVYEGIRHILSGYDHLLFLLMLILPAIASSRLRQGMLRMAGIVTAFTVSHSVTLALATTGIVTLPGRPVEVAIAASIVVAAGINIWRPGHRVGWQLAFGFGLLHGFGFAGALAEFGLSSGSLLKNLFAFNVGVELGQLLVIAVALPVLALLALWPKYGRVLVPSLSAAGAAMGLIWTASRL